MLRRLPRVFYDRLVAADPLIGPLFASAAPDHPERVADWLGEVFGGPAASSGQRGGYARIVGEHLDKHLTEAQRARWVAPLLQAADVVDLPAAVGSVVEVVVPCAVGAGWSSSECRSDGRLAAGAGARTTRCVRPADRLTG